MVDAMETVSTPVASDSRQHSGWWTLLTGQTTQQPGRCCTPTSRFPSDALPRRRPPAAPPIAFRSRERPAHNGTQRVLRSVGTHRIEPSILTSHRLQPHAPQKQRSHPSPAPGPHASADAHRQLLAPRRPSDARPRTCGSPRRKTDQTLESLSLVLHAAIALRNGQRTTEHFSLR